MGAEEIHDIAKGDALQELHGFDHSHFQMQFLVAGLAHAILGGGEVVDQFQQAVVGHDFPCGFEQASAFRCYFRQLVFRIDGKHEHVAQEGHEIPEKVLQVAPALVLGMDESQGSGGILAEDVGGEVGDDAGGSESEDLDRVVFLDGVAAERDELVEHALGIAHPAIGSARDGLGGGGREMDLFLFRDMEQVGGDDPRRNRAQIKTLAPAQDGRQHLLRFRGREDEFHMRRGFLERLEQGIEGLRREHVDFVDVVDFVARAGGSVLHGLAQLAHLVHAIVRGTIDFQDIERPAFGDLDA